MNILSWLTAGLAGWFWVQALLPRAPAPGWIRHGLAASLAFIFGAGATASAFFALLWAGLAPPAAAWTADALVLASGAALYQARRGRRAEERTGASVRAAPLAWLGGIAAAVCVAAFLAAVYLVAGASPQGDWDAWTIWNVRAKFLAHEGLWRNAVSPELAESHPEYPLLWPAAVARAWSESGAITQAAPQAGAFFSSLALVMMFAFGVAARAGWQWGALATATLLMTTPLWRSAPGQVADIPLAALMLAAVVAAAAGQRAGWDAAGLALSGALASMAAFTKTEGLAFCVLLGVTLAVAARARAAWWLAGAAPVLALAALFHWLLAPPGARVAAAGFAQFGRLLTALREMALELWRLGDFPAHPLLFVALLWFAFRPKWPLQPMWAAAAALATAGAGLIALWGFPGDVAAQVRASGDRLLLQVTPVLLLCFFWWLGHAEEAPADAGRTRPPKRKPGLASEAKH